MKTILMLANTILLMSLTVAGEGDLITVRNLYYKAAADAAAAKQFHEYLQKKPKIPAALLLGYTGMSFMIKANHSWNPYYKLSYFNEGRDFLESAIKKDPNNVELRFLRFCIQTNAPGFLAYSGQITNDKKVILTAYANLNDNDLKGRIKNYLLGSSYCTAQDRLTLN